MRVLSTAFLFAISVHCFLFYILTSSGKGNCESIQQVDVVEHQILYLRLLLSIGLFEQMQLLVMYEGYLKADFKRYTTIDWPSCPIADNTSKERFSSPRGRPHFLTLDLSGL